MFTFSAMTAIRMDQEYHRMFCFFGCAAIVAEIAINVPYETLFEWTNSTHLCLPLEAIKLKDKLEVREKTVFVSSLKQPQKT